MSALSGQGFTVTKLKRARDLICEECKWARGAYGYDTNGGEVGDNAPMTHAVTYDAQGALRAISGAFSDITLEGIALESALPTGYDCVATYNDDPRTTHENIMELFDRAIDTQQRELAVINKRSGVLR